MQKFRKMRNSPIKIELFTPRQKQQKYEQAATNPEGQPAAHFTGAKQVLQINYMTPK